MEASRFFKKIEAYAGTDALPVAEEYLQTLGEVTGLLSAEDPALRRGGLVYLYNDLPVLILPDLHGRRGFFLSALVRPLPSGISPLELLFKSELQIVCVGDGFHGEARAVRRWYRAYDEHLGGYRQHAAMDSEMIENFAIMRMVMHMKLQFPRLFHFLKGNHENILNEEGEGNYPFGKFVNEGEMVYTYVQKRYGTEFTQKYSLFEKSLPLLVQGRKLLISHAEPARVFNEEEVINFKENSEVIYGLTWTGNDEAEEGSVQAMLQLFFPGEKLEDLFYIGGHRPVEGLYHLRAGNKFIQIHNPNKRVCAFVPVDERFNPKKHIYALPGREAEEEGPVW
jgi:hypothetical protein